MEGMADVAYTGNFSDEAITCNVPTVLLPPIDSNIKPEGEILSEATSNMSINGGLNNKEYINGISPVHEVASYDNILGDCSKTLVENEGNSVSKIVPPTIFENAVKVVKNLFSPAKGHGIFSSGTSLNEQGMKKIGNEDMMLILRPDEVEGKGRVSPLTRLDNEDDMSNTTVKNSSNSLSVHDNTNDSYTTTVSIMDESFQSTITHFDENMQNEPMIAVEKALDGSLNDTMKTNDNSLDTTLKKDLSICSTVLNGTFGVPAVGAVENAGNTETGLIQVSPGAENQMSSSPSQPEENFLSFQEEGMLKIGTFSSTPSKRNSPKEEKSFSSSVQENGDTVKSCATQDSVKLSQQSSGNQSSEMDFSFFSVRHENGFPEKSSTPKSGDLEKNFSTSTIILTKDERETLDFSSVKEEKEAINVTFDVQVEPDEANSMKIPEIEEMSSNVLEKNILASGLENSSGDNTGSKDGVGLEPEVKDSTMSDVPTTIIPDADLQTVEPKPEGYSADETGIPLASQKSYTVLHNPNPDLNRPVVLDYMCDVQAEKLNDIILGNCAFSDLGVFNNGSEELITDCCKSDVNIGLVNVKPDPEKEVADVKPISGDISDVLINAKQEFDIAEVFPGTGGEESTVGNNVRTEDGIKPDVVKSESVVAVYHGSLLTGKNPSEPELEEVKERETPDIISCTGNNTLSVDGSSPSTENIAKVENDIPAPEVSDFQTQIEKMTSDLEKLKMNDSMKKDCNDSKLNDSTEQSSSGDSSKNSVKASGSDTEITQFIQEQFSAFDIEKICSVVDDVPELNLSKNIVLASEQFDKSFHEKTVIESDFAKPNFVIGDEKSLSSALDFLDSIKGKPSGRDFSRESLYVKFDPLVQTKRSTELLDISEGDKENLIITPGPITDQLIPITPLKQTINVSSPLSPLTPVTQKSEPKISAEKLNKIKELQNEIAKSRELFLQMEEINKEKMNNYEREIAKLTGRACVLEDKLKESEEMEKSLVKKLNVQNESMNRLKNIMEEYLAYIEKLTDQIETERMASHKQIEVLTEEKDYYMNHLQNTEQAFSDVHSKYEKCKKAVEIYKKNEETYKTSIEDFKERIEQYREKIKEIQENAAKEMNRLQEKMSEMKVNHAQEISRFKAQLRKTELKVQTIQEALDQKVKENQELARICDELIDGKKRSC